MQIKRYLNCSLWIEKKPRSGHVLLDRHSATRMILEKRKVTLTEHHSAKKSAHRSTLSSGEISRKILLAGALNSVEELPPHVERSLDRGPHFCALHFTHRHV